MITAYGLLTVCWLLLPVSLAAILVGAGELRRRLYRELPGVSIVTAAFLALYSLMGARWSMGLEYEDAFEYLYSGHILAADESARTLDLNPLCVDRSALECLQYETLSHPIGISTAVSWEARLMGPSLVQVRDLSLFWMWIACLTVFGLLRTSGAGYQTALFSCILLMTTPVCLALGGTGLAEPTSAGLILLTVSLSQLYLVHSERATPDGWPIRLLIGTAYSSALLLTVFAKRESLLLPVVLPSGHLLAWLNRRRVSGTAPLRGPLQLLALSAALLILALTASPGGMLPWDSIRPAAKAPFSLENLMRWGADYSGHLFSSRFMALVPLALLGLCCWRARGHHLALITVTIGYLCLFFSFGHSYYAEVLGETPYFHFERYTLQITPLLAVLAGLACDEIYARTARLRPTVRWLSTLAGVIVLVVGAILGLRYRAALTSEEDELRVAPVRAACGFMPAGGVVIVPEPILWALYCDKPLRVLAFPSLGRGISAATIQQLGNEQPLFLWQRPDATETDWVRYPLAAATLAPFRRETTLETSGHGWRYSLYQLR